ncbi:MAG: response regulator [Bacteroidales bacterium]|nr:response regulator [Bacteroidales bacterium]MCF8389660.1 response regulator [Bacteroidales bacterium]
MTSENILNIDWSGRSILIVEDEEINYLFIETLLSVTSAKVIHVWNGQQAVDRIKENNETFDLILMDIKMPIMNGFEATKEIRVLQPLVPIIAQTAFTLGDDRDRSFAAGCNDFLTKPIRKNELISIMSKYLS